MVIDAGEGYCANDINLITGGQGGPSLIFGLFLIFFPSKHQFLSRFLRNRSPHAMRSALADLQFLSNIRLPRPSRRTVAGSGMAR